MFKYLKKLFHDLMVHSRKLVGVSESSSDQIEMFVPEVEEIVNSSSSAIIERNSMIDDRLSDNLVDHLDNIDHRELSRQLREIKLRLKNESNFYQPEVTNEKKKNLRKLSRDKRKLPVATKSVISEEKICRKNDICQCDNCSTIATMSECGVCLEPLQTRGVRSCPLCANIVCSECASQLKRCAYCRIGLPMQKNPAIERFIRKLELPCRNARSGCKKLLKPETRLSHEVICIYASNTCPISCDCNWQGSPDMLLGHLERVHDLKPLADNGVEIELSNFRGNSSLTQQECTVFLSCYSQLYAVKVTHRKKLIVTLFQLGYIDNVNEKVMRNKYRILVRIKTNENKKMRGILSFDAFDRDTREIEMDSEQLFSKSNNSKDTLNIDISIRQKNNYF